MGRVRRCQASAASAQMGTGGTHGGVSPVPTRTGEGTSQTGPLLGPPLGWGKLSLATAGPGVILVETGVACECTTGGEMEGTGKGDAER